jgi:hypothetical protein
VAKIRGKEEIKKIEEEFRKRYLVSFPKNLDFPGNISCLAPSFINSRKSGCLTFEG